VERGEQHETFGIISTLFCLAMCCGLGQTALRLKNASVSLHVWPRHNSTNISVPFFIRRTFIGE
jgi:hypothetical protein